VISRAAYVCFYSFVTAEYRERKCREQIYLLGSSEITFSRLRPSFYARQFCMSVLENNFIQLLRKVDSVMREKCSKINTENCGGVAREIRVRKN
jgi:hypothetical protein